MAKSKDPAYVAERLRRTVYRKQARRTKTKNSGKECPDCGGCMSWCTICDVWTKDCCQDYGSCLCN